MQTRIPMWFEVAKYDHDVMWPQDLEQFAGPHGIATVKVFDTGKTSKGWGEAAFMDRYKAGKFNDQIAKVGWMSGRWDFAFVMRSLQLVCIDIDGKNGGFENAGKLGQLPVTLAETSKSGNGYHLFYSTPWDKWDDEKGYAGLRDRVGLYEGIDIRAVGCVFHYPNQQWNREQVAELPNFLRSKWQADAAAGQAQVEEILALVQSSDDEAVLLMQHELKRDLHKPIPAGRRNNTLFAIGVKMHAAQVPGWETELVHRAQAVGLDNAEASKIVANVLRYGAATTP